MYALSAQNTSTPFVGWPPQDTPRTPATCAPAPYVENLVMWAPVAQLLLQCVHSLPEWVTNKVLKSEPQDYDGGNVTVEEAPISFSPFSLTDHTMLSHFSFNDFIAIVLWYVYGQGLFFSIIHLLLLTANSPFTFTVLVLFFADTFRYVVW